MKLTMIKTENKNLEGYLAVDENGKEYITSPTLNLQWYEIAIFASPLVMPLIIGLTLMLSLR